MACGWARIALRISSVQMRITSGLVQQSCASPFCRLPLDQREIFGMRGRNTFSGGTRRLNVWTKKPSPNFTLPPCFSSSRALLEFIRFRAFQSGSRTQSATIRLAGFEGGNLAVVDRANGQARRLRNAAYARREPAAAQVIFQQAVHAVHRAAHRPAGNDQMVADRANHVAFLAEGGEIDLHAQACADGRCRRG